MRITVVLLMLFGCAVDTTAKFTQWCKEGNQIGTGAEAVAASEVAGASAAKGAGELAAGELAAGGLGAAEGAGALGALDAGAGLTEAGWGMGAGGLGGDAAGLIGAGGTSLLGAGTGGATGAGGLDPTTGLTEAGWSAGPGGLGGDAASLSPGAQGALGTGGSPVSAPASGPTGGVATPGGTAPVGMSGETTGVQAILDKMKKQLSENPFGAVGAGIGAASLMNQGKQVGKAAPQEAQLNALGQQASGISSDLLAQYKSGNLSASQQASMDQITQGTKNQITQYFSSIGQADSTAHKQALAQVDQQALAQKQQFLDNALQQGLNAIGVAQGPLNTVAQYQLGQDKALRDAFGSFAQGLGNIAGRSSGETKPTTTPQSVPPS